MNFDTDSNDENKPLPFEKPKHSMKQAKQNVNKNNGTKDNKDNKINDKGNYNEKEFNLEVATDDENVSPYPILPKNFEKAPFVRVKENYGPYQLDQVELIEKFNKNKKSSSFKKYLKKYENTDSLILKYLTNTGSTTEFGIDFDKIAQSNFIKPVNQNNKDFVKTMGTTKTENMDDVELEGYSEQILGYRNTINDDGINFGSSDTFKKLSNRAKNQANQGSDIENNDGYINIKGSVFKKQSDNYNSSYNQNELYKKERENNNLEMENNILREEMEKMKNEMENMQYKVIVKWL